MIQFTSPHRKRTRRSAIAALCSVVAIGAALVGCSSDGNGNGNLAELQQQLDMEEAARMEAEEQLATLSAQIEALMARADITPEALAALRAQIETLMGRADITPGDLAALRTQIETLMGRADITPGDLAALRAQIETLMGRADITPEAVAALRAQIETLMGRADITPGDLAALRAQIDTLMGRADITPGDLAALRAQIETLMGRAEITPEALAALRDQVETLMARADAAEQALADLPLNSAVVNAIEKVAVWGLNLGVDQESGLLENITAWLVTSQAYADSGSEFAVLSQTHKYGNLIVFAVPFRDESGDQHFFVDSVPADGSLHDEVNVFTWSRIDTRQADREGVTTSYGPIEDHGLGAEWQGFELARAYDEDGVWTVRLFADSGESDDLAGPYTGFEYTGFDEYERDILLTDDRVYIPHGRDGVYVILPEDGLQGSLDGVAGTFSCDGFHCSMVNDVDLSRYIPWVDSNSIRFTPADGGPAVMLDLPQLVAPSSPAPKVNILTFGSWLYAPEDTTDVQAYDFGVFAGGDDPFAAGNLAGLTGTAAYAGKAAGTYAEILHPRTESFTADVAFTADFGFLTEEVASGMTGALSNFNLASGDPSPVSALSLASGWWQVDIPGGRILGSVSSSDGNWSGTWGGRFYGNDPADPAAHPTAFAGTFGADDDARLFAGSFGAREQ